MRQRLIYILKHNLVIQAVYKAVMSFLFRVWGLFIRQDPKLVLFSSFGGKKYNDSPKILFERMREDPAFSGFRFVWAFEEPEKFDIPGAECIRIDTMQYFKTALKAGLWITSVNIERGLHFKKKGTFYVNTWHGAGTKKIGNACNGRKDYNFGTVDLMLVQSHFEEEIFLRDFLCRPEAIRILGFPRNDELFHITEEKKKELRKQFNIPEGKKVVLYAPTWRDSQDGGLTYEVVLPIDMEKWKKELSDDHVMLFRMHAFTTKFEMKYDEFARDVSAYENLNHILAITDVLITDYSTIVYDSAAFHIPFICFGFDYERYNAERGFYFDLNEVYPGGVLKTEDEVLQRIRAVEKGADRERYEAFREKYIEAGGSAADKVLEELRAVVK